MEACAALQSSYNPELLIIGDGPERARLEHLGRTTPLDVRFLGHLEGDALAELFRSADLFVLPGIGGLAVQEAMSFGLPVIVAEGDGTQDDLVRNTNGWSIGGATCDLLVRVIREALSDVHRLRCMGRESYRIVSEEINLEAMAQTFVDAFIYATDNRRNGC
jgi:glycosyltransferase involved in cell wall biosynthesis